MASSSTNTYPNYAYPNYPYPSEYNASDYPYPSVHNASDYPYPSEYNASDYPYPWEFNVSDLVPDKLSKSNYKEWKPLMLDFIESRGMNEFIHHTAEDIEDPDFEYYNETSWRNSDGLVRAWILSTLNKDIVKQVLPHKTAKKVWMALETMFGSRKQPDSSSYMEIDRRLGNYMPLHINAIQGDIQSAIEFIHDEPEAIRMPISTEGETMLITAVRSVQRNKLVEYLLGKLSEKDLAQRDNLGRTALHEAAEVGNLEAAKMLVKKNTSLPYIEDHNGQIPLLYAAKTGNREMVRFVLDCVKRSGVLKAGREPPTLLYHLANSGLYDIALELLQQNSMLECTGTDTDTDTSTGSKTCPLMAMSQKRSSFRSGTPLNSFHKFIYSIAPAKLRNNATKNPAEHCEGNTENSANRENPDENLQRPIDTENLANTENPVENLQSHTENPANRENPQNLPQNLVANENPHNDAVNPAINENRQNPPAITDTENSLVDENPRNGAVNLVVNENRQNPLAITDDSIINENLRNVAINPAINENRQNPPAVTDTENSVVDENPQYGAVTENPPIIENNLQNPVNIADSENPQNCTITENPIVNENPQIINENSQNLIVTDNSIVNENPHIHIDVTEDSETEDETPHYDIDSTQNPVNNDNLGNQSDLVVDGIGRWHAILWHLADELVPAIKHDREIKLKHDEALELVKCLCKEIAKLDFSTAKWMFTPALAQATSSGIHEIVEEILRSFPAAISFKNEKDQSIFQSAIVWRRENVFNLIYQLKECSHKFLSVPDKFGNNALHLAGCLGPQQHLSVRVSAAGAALQMQRELQWFKEVEKFALPQDKECRNDKGMTPAEVFTKTHKKLVEAGERWMKDTATSCTIVAVLIATVMFAAAITVPGGNNASSGVSIFSKQKAFVIFGLSDALALFASIASLLMFLSILTARYAEEDFLFTLPKRLICGLVYLFLSISSTMTAFGATVYLMMGENRPWIIYPIVAFTYIPVHLFVSLLLPLLVVMYKSTHRPAIFGKQSDHMLF